MGLFSKKPNVVVCEMCERSHAEGCGSTDKHVVEIKSDAPAWLPTNFRARAQGGFTFLCTRCDSYPCSPAKDVGDAKIFIIKHLGGDHHVGLLAGRGDDMRRLGTMVEMIAAQ